MSGDSNLVTEGDGFDRQISGVTAPLSQQFERSDGGDIEEGQSIVHPHWPGVGVATLLLRTGG